MKLKKTISVLTISSMLAISGLTLLGCANESQ